MISNILNIFSIDWWMDENNNALQMTDSILFLLLTIPVAYLFSQYYVTGKRLLNPLITSWIPSNTHAKNMMLP